MSTDVWETFAADLAEENWIKNVVIEVGYRKFV